MEKLHHFCIHDIYGTVYKMVKSRTLTRPMRDPTVALWSHREYYGIYDGNYRLWCGSYATLGLLFWPLCSDQGSYIQVHTWLFKWMRVLEASTNCLQQKFWGAQQSNAFPSISFTIPQSKSLALLCKIIKEIESKVFNSFAETNFRHSVTVNSDVVLLKCSLYCLCECLESNIRT